MNYKKIALCILDGWGVGNKKVGNAIYKAKTPCFDMLSSSYLYTKIFASGNYVGTTDGFCGNSEIGHLTIGAGRTIDSEYRRVNSFLLDSNAVKDRLENLLMGFDHLNGSLHLMGIVSDASIHGNIDHFLYIIEFFANRGVSVLLHLFLDGRDVYKMSAIKYIGQIESFILNYSNVKIATVSGRYYAMDRDSNFSSRTKLSYDAIAEGIGHKIEGSMVDFIENNYKNGITDEFIEPSIYNGYCGFNPNTDIGFISNIRSDRAIQLLKSLLDLNFDDFKCKKKFATIIGFVEFSCSNLKNYKFCLSKQRLKNTLGSVISDSNRTQLRIAETEKYAHVTFFFNGGIDVVFGNESRKMIPSIKVKNISDYPHMRSQDITDALIKEKDNYDFFVINYAAPDIIGHTGNFNAVVDAVEKVDSCIQLLVDRFINDLKNNETALIITADHGNAEYMIDEEGHVNNSHTLSQVPFIVVSNDINERFRIKTDSANFSLRDIAPTILHLFGIDRPEDMLGHSILEENS